MSRLQDVEVDTKMFYKMVKKKKRKRLQKFQVE